MSEKTFENAIEELEAIVKKLESGEGTLDESLGDFEKAVLLVKECNEMLQSAEKRLTVLTQEEAQV